MNTTNFIVTPGGSCKSTRIAPDQQSIKTILNQTKKSLLEKDLIIIARYQWLKRNKLMIPENVELANLCLKINKGTLTQVFYSNVLTHVIKKQKYYIKILN